MNDDADDKVRSAGYDADASKPWRSRAQRHMAPATAKNRMGVDI